MKLRQYTLKNFQNHEKSILDFHSNINIISGSSRNGKSALLRGLRLAFENRPTGNEFLPHNCSSKTVSSSEVVFDDITIKRERGTTKNSYKLTKDGKTTEYKKFGLSVPEDIQDALNLKDYNFQSQHSQYFLLQDTGSEVASKLNDIAGLQIIDTTLANVKSFVNTAKSDVKTTTALILGYDERLEELEFIGEVEKIVQQIDEKTGQFQQLNSDIEQLDEQLTKIEKLEKDLQLLKTFLKVVPKVKSVQKKLDKHSSFVVEYTELKRSLEKIEVLEFKKEKLEKVLEQKQVVSEINEKVDLFSTISKELKDLSRCVKKVSEFEELNIGIEEWLSVKKYLPIIDDAVLGYQRLESDIEELDISCFRIQDGEMKLKKLGKRIAEKEMEKRQVIKDMGICPLCGGTT